MSTADNAFGSGAIDELDRLLSADDLYDLPPERVRELRLCHARSAVRWHLTRNQRYAAYCRGQGFEPDQLASSSDIGRIPLLPSSVFKRGADVVSTLPADDEILLTTSSGTQGTVSVVPRDDRTLRRFYATLAIGTREVLGLEASALRLFNLGPSRAEHLWIAYVMTGVAMFMQSRSYVDGDRFRVQEALDDLRALGPREPALVVGPPPLMLELAGAAGAASLRLAPSSLFVTIGGWKRARGSVPPRGEFDRLVAGAFGLADAARVRDTFNMVELNSVLFECAGKEKHCPPWLAVEARDPRSLAPLPPSTSGILAYVDPTPTSYPGFVLSDDFGTVVEDHRCACGRTGDVLRIERRISRIESRGCALKLDVAVGA